jgi:hypothetical protein
MRLSPIKLTKKNPAKELSATALTAIFIEFNCNLLVFTDKPQPTPAS